MSTTGGTTGGPTPCVVDSDCQLQNDCCTCAGIPADEMAISCLIDCTDLACEAKYGYAAHIDQAVCIAGECGNEVNCDEAQVQCEAAPPQCPAGTVPEVGTYCYTFQCVPVEQCANVPAYVDCPAGTVRVTNSSAGPAAWTSCRELPAACNGTPSCACMGDEVCTGLASSCAETMDGLSCSCPACA